MPIAFEVSRIIKLYDSKLDEIIHEDLLILKKIKKHVIESGGKRIRPLTHYFLCQLLDYKGKLWQDVGAIAELIHGASLLHDDVVDGASSRRGKPTVGSIYGNKTAILAGDYLLASGIEHLNGLKNPRLMDSYTRVIRDLAVGELLQMEWEKNPKISLEIYEKIIFGKTSSLFGAVAETAGILVDLSSDKIQQLHAFGVTMGNLFQKKDDYIDYFDSKTDSGKEPLKDFQNGLYTYPILILLNSASKSDKKEIHQLLSKETKNQSDGFSILDLMAKYEIREKILESLRKDAQFLTVFLEKFPDKKIKKLMIERIQEIVS